LNNRKIQIGNLNTIDDRIPNKIINGDRISSMIPNIHCLNKLM